ncbi:hypothetical protein NDU88_005453 [Pleurodeles waltl]|uniref:Uncharacterized protein n=1 Tax=Pleurodeles waltl TaxID=8319 RepID=A0AAV7RL26_PLEWA|nr:hypothetical protein NDU88_005453 [Pleurodeles waltl]
MGGLGFPACTRGAVHRGRAAHLVLSFSAGVSATSRPQGSAVGALVQAPQGLSPLLQFAAYAISKAIGPTSAQPGASLSCRHLLFPSRDRQDLRASVGCRILVRLPYTTPYETQGHRGARNGVFLLLRTTLTMGG